MADNINPEHYKAGGIETIEYLQAKLSNAEYYGYLKGNALKYISREGLKSDKLLDKIEDCKKGTQIKYRARIGYKEGEDAISDIDKMDWYRNKEKEIYVAEQQDIKTKVMLQMQEQELHDED